MKHFSLLAIAIAGFATAPVHAQEIVKLTAASGLSQASAGTGMMANFFLPEVNKRLAEKGEYQVEWTTGWGGSIASQFDMLEAVEDGIVDIAYVNTLHESAKLPMEQVSFVTPFGPQDVKTALKIFNKVRQAVPEMDEEFLKLNQRRLSVVGLNNYHLLTTFEVSKYEDLNGKKMGAPGLASNWIDGTGAVAVGGGLSEYYNSLKTGVYDGIIMFESGSASFKFYEVAPIITRIGFGAQIVSNVTINEDAWQRLPQEVQETLAAVGAEYEQRLADKTVELAAKGLKTASENGATVNEIAPEQVARFAAELPDIAGAWAADIDSRGLPGTKLLETYLDIAEQEGVTFARDWGQ